MYNKVTQFLPRAVIAFGSLLCMLGVSGIEAPNGSINLISGFIILLGATVCLIPVILRWDVNGIDFKEEL